MNTNTSVSRTCQTKTLTLAVLATIAGSTALSVAAQTTPTGTAASADKKPQIETITVTAQKRKEDAQKTPLAVTSVSGEEIAEQGVRNARDLNGLVPNVVINTNATATEFTIRGITSTNNTEIGNPAVGFHLDGVYLARPQSAGLAFFDVERVEVLRGPQGTLWGRNVTAGAINVITNKPKDKLEGSVMLEVGNYDSRRSEFMINAPVNDVFSIRAALATEKRDGYLISQNPAVGATKNADDADTTAARIHALIEPNKNFSILLTADTMRARGVGYGTVALPLASTSGNAGRTTTPSLQPRLANDEDGYSAEVNWSFGPTVLTYLGSKRTGSRDEINFSAPNTARTAYRGSPEQTSHELRLSSANQKTLTWVVGAYTIKESDDISLTAENINALAGVPASLRVSLSFLQPQVSQKANAVFGQATFAATDSLKLTAGLRSTRDELSRVGRNLTTVTLPNGTPVAPTTTAPNNASISSSKVNWRVAADYSIDKDTMLYGSIATGYKAGGFFDGVRSANFDNTYKPENVTTYEAGLKMRALDGTLRTNIAVFRNDFKDLQVSYRGPSPSGIAGSFITLTQNAAEATINGAEIESRWLSAIGRFDLSLALLDAKYDSFDPPNANPRVNNTGNSLIKSPRVSGNLAYQYNWPFAGGDLNARISMFFTEKYYLQPTNIALTTQPAYQRTDVSLTYIANKEAWYVQAYGKNLENKNVIAGIGGLAAPNAFLAPPRTYGVRVGFKF